jgi:hypothetical protein
MEDLGLLSSYPDMCDWGNVYFKIVYVVIMLTVKISFTVHDM